MLIVHMGLVRAKVNHDQLTVDGQNRRTSCNNDLSLEKVKDELATRVLNPGLKLASQTVGQSDSRRARSVINFTGCPVAFVLNCTDLHPKWTDLCLKV